VSPMDSFDPTLLRWTAGGLASAASVLGFVAFRRTRAAATGDPHADRAPGQLSAGACGDHRDGGWRRLVRPLAVHLRPASRDDLDQLTTRLLQAGRRSRDEIDRHGEDRVLALVGGMAVAILGAAVVGGALGMVLAAIALIGGLFGPMKYLELRAAERREAIAATLPSAVDLLTTCVDAGLSLEHAIARVARETQAAAPTLATELSLTAGELDAGVPLPDALRRLSRRVGLDALSALCGVLAQAHGLGAPIGDTLREFAAASRRARTSMLEERAGKLAAQMTLPLALCLLPAALLIMLGPAVLQLVRALQ